VPSYVARGGVLSIREKIYSFRKATTTRIATRASPVLHGRAEWLLRRCHDEVASSPRNLSTAAAW